MNAVTIPSSVLQLLLTIAYERCPARLLTDNEADQLWDAVPIVHQALQPTNNHDVIGRIPA